MPSPERDHWERAQQFLRQRQLPAAAQQLHSLQSIAPGGTRTCLLAAQIAWQEGRVRVAAEHALAAAVPVTHDPSLVIELVTTLRTVGEVARAHEVFERFDWRGLASPDLVYRRAILCQGFGEYEQALAVFDQLAARTPDEAQWQFFRGQQLEFMGRYAQAASSYEACLAKSPGFGYALYKLARLRPQTPDDDLLKAIDAGMPFVQPGTSGRADLEFARYHILERMGRTEEAWQALVTANAAMHALGLEDVAAGEAGLQHFCARMAAQSIPAGGEAPDGPCPIFIVGMPRTGTTVLERMLANHSQVVGLGELTDFGAQLLRVLGHRDLFGEHSASSIASVNYYDVGRGYLKQTAWRTGGKAYFVDKQPTNWMMVGPIHAALPQAKILHLVRDPMDTCFSVWRARFADAHAWSYMLDAIPRHLDTYQRLMQHWHQALPGVVLDVDYGALVDEPAATLRRVMAFCDLEWEPGCEDLSRNAAPVSTLSSTQVREPVNTRGLGRWRPYVTHLDPLRRALETGPGSQTRV